jgi:predicted signal transduction protein with EAL and GGDEF domain
MSPPLCLVSSIGHPARYRRANKDESGVRTSIIPQRLVSGAVHRATAQERDLGIVMGRERHEAGDHRIDLARRPRSGRPDVERTPCLGVAVSVDDFGTGYSSLSSILTLPIDEFKIDRSFVASLPAATSAAVAETIVRLGHTLRLGIVAEGIETNVQWDALRQLGCHFGQSSLPA